MYTMNVTLKTGLAMLCIVFFNTGIQAQTKEWTTETTKDGKITAKYHISSRTNEAGEKVPLIESITTSTEKISIDKCIALMKDVSKHKDFHGDESSELLKAVSENKWAVYYYTDGTAFTPDADGAYMMTRTAGKPEGATVFTITAEPNLVAKKEDVKRVTYFNEVFTFEDLGNGLVRITLTSKMSPAFQVPNWILKMSFPDLLFEVMQKFTKLAHNEQS